MVKRVAAGALLVVMTLAIASGPASADTRGPISQIGGVPLDSTDASTVQADFDQLTVEDALMLMFALIAADARQDMLELLNDLDATRLAKDALRDAESLLRGDFFGCPRCWPAG